MNASAAIALRVDAEEVLGEVLHPQFHRTRADGSYYESGAGPIYSVLRGDGSVRVATEFMWRIDGTSFAAEYSVFPDHRGRNGDRCRRDVQRHHRS